MNKTTMILLLISELLLLLKLALNQDLVLALIIALSQFVIVMAAFNFESKEARAEDVSIKKRLIIVGLVFLSIVPLLLHHQNHFERSTWTEAGLLIQGPFSILLILLGVFGAAIASLTSLYLRGKK